MNEEREKIIGLAVDCGFVVTNSHGRRDTTVWSAYEGEILTFANALLEMCARTCQEKTSSSVMNHATKFVLRECATDIRMMKFSADDDDR